MAQNIVAQFPTVSKADLLYGDSCAICHETYTSEAAVRLPCGHEFGSDCISTWISPEQGRVTCPLCRHQLVAPTTNASEADETRAIFDHVVMAIELEIEITERDLNRHRSRRFREWLLYAELHSQGADLPPWRSETGEMRTNLGPYQEEALFQELLRMEAFLMLPFEVDPLMTVREIWECLRDSGYSWHPEHVDDGTDECGWTQSEEMLFSVGDFVI